MYCTQVLVASPGKGMMLERSRLACELWSADIPAEWGNEKANPNFKDQLQKADDEGIPFVVVLGEAELAKVSRTRLSLQLCGPPVLMPQERGCKKGHRHIKGQLQKANGEGIPLVCSFAAKLPW